MPATATLWEAPHGALAVVSSCSAAKRDLGGAPLDRRALSNPDVRRGALRDTALPRLPARDLYQGRQHQAVVRGIEVLRGAQTTVAVRFFIVSAGFGIVDEDTSLPAYECSFNDFGLKAMDAWARALAIPQDYRRIVESARLTLVLLGDRYLRALGRRAEHARAGAEVILTTPRIARELASDPGVRAVICSHARAKTFGEASIAFKGALFERFACAFAALDPAQRQETITDAAKVQALFESLPAP